MSLSWGILIKQILPDNSSNVRTEAGEEYTHDHYADVNADCQRLRLFDGHQQNRLSPQHVRYQRVYCYNLSNKIN